MNNGNQVRHRSYRLVLSGELSDRFGFLFEGMQIERLAGTTVLTGPVADQAHLLGLIEHILELGAELLSVEPADGPAAQPPGPAAGRDLS